MAMRPPSASDLLRVWDGAAGHGPVGRGLALLAAACPDLSRDELADLSIGQRDGRLLALREAIFGPDMVGVANCPSCDDVIETCVTTTALRVDTPLAPSLELERAGYRLRLRPLTSRDLAAVEDAAPPLRRQALFDRCIVTATRGEESVAVVSLPAEIAEAAIGELAKADAQADIQLAIACPGCGQRWRAPFDIVAFLWAELEASAGRLLREVHVLASAYGWSEREILSLGPARRQRYLGMVQSWPIS